MSQSGRDLRREFRKDLPITELYRISCKNAGDWGIDEYKVPGTVSYRAEAMKFPIEKRKDSFFLAAKRSLEPDPRKYSPDREAEVKLWTLPSGKFPKADKKTELDQLMKKSKAFPGPGQYFKLPPAPVPNKTIQ